MKVEGPKAPQVAARPGQARKTGESGAFSKLLDAGEAGEAQSAAPNAGVGAVGGLFMLQSESDDERKRRQKAIEHAHGNLDILDQLMRALLDNSLSMRSLEQLRGKAVHEGQEVADPQLASILTQIDIRLAVEAAKLEKAAESNT